MASYKFNIEKFSFHLRKHNQTDLSKKINISQPTISRIVRGKNSPSIDVFLKQGKKV